MNTGCGALRDFFISYSRADSAWAIWIAWVLEEHGYTCLLDQWDFQRGGNWVLEMHRATRETKRTLVVLSSNYLAAQFTQAEWTSAFKRDPTGEQGLIVPVRVEECEGEGVLGQTLYIELVGKEERAARRALLDGVRQQRSKPVDPPTFPAAVPKGDRAVPKPPSFPGSQRNGSHSKPHPFPGPSPIMSRVFAAATLLSPLVAALVAGILMGWDHPLRYFLSPLAIETRWWDRSPAVPLGNQTLGFYGDRNNNEVAMGLEKKMSRRFEVDTGIKVDPLDNPQPEDRLPIARNAIRSGKYDAVMIDIVWAGELAPDLVDLKPFFEESEIEQHSQEIINNNTIGGAPVAIPWFQEIGLLYYRNDLLERDNEKFDTWEALEEAATRIQEKEKSKMPDFNGFALQGSDHEGLTCNALEWIASWGGLDTNTGKILFNNEGVLEALDRARKWVNGERAISRDAKGFEEEGFVANVPSRQSGVSALVDLCLREA